MIQKPPIVDSRLLIFDRRGPFNIQNSATINRKFPPHHEIHKELAPVGSGYGITAGPRNTISQITAPARPMAKAQRSSIILRFPGF